MPRSESQGGNNAPRARHRVSELRGVGDDGADMLAARRDFDDAVDRSDHVGMAGVAGMAERGAEVTRADEQHVEILDRAQRLDILDHFAHSRHGAADQSLEDWRAAHNRERCHSLRRGRRAPSRVRSSGQYFAFLITSRTSAALRRGHSLDAAGATIEDVEDIGLTGIGGG